MNTSNIEGQTDVCTLLALSNFPLKYLFSFKKYRHKVPIRKNCKQFEIKRAPLFRTAEKFNKALKGNKIILPDEHVF
jgi:hypothetical protein